MTIDYNPPTSSEPRPQWVIDSIQDSFGPAGLSVPQRYKRVNYHTFQGDISYIEVPLQPGWQDAAASAIQKHVDELYELKSRTGPMVS